MTKRRGFVTLGALGLLVVVTWFLVSAYPWKSATDPYNYPSMGEAGDRVVPTISAVGPGSPMPQLTVYDLEHQAVPLDTLWADRPLVIEFGSRTCPIFAGGGTTMDELAAKYRTKATIGVLYVREAHPGSAIAEHASMEQKLELAKSLGRSLERPVWVDSLDGAVHRALISSFNGVYVVGTDGIVAYRATWNRPDEVERVLQSLLDSGGRGSDVADRSEYLCLPPLHLPVLDRMRYAVNIARGGGANALPDFLVNGLPRMLAKADPASCP